MKLKKRKVIAREVLVICIGIIFSWVSTVILIIFMGLEPTKGWIVMLLSFAIYYIIRAIIWAIKTLRTKEEGS